MDTEQDIADLNALTREAHECIKDLNQTIRTATQILDRAATLRAEFETTMNEFEDKVQKVAELNVRDMITEVANVGIEKFSEQMIAHIEETETAINGRFDRLTKLLMFEEDGGERIQGLTLPDYIQAVADYNAGIPVKKREGQFTYAPKEEE